MNWVEKMGDRLFFAGVNILMLCLCGFVTALIFVGFANWVVYMFYPAPIGFVLMMIGASMDRG